MRDETEIKTEYMKQKLRSEIERMKEINDQKIYSQIDQIILQESKEEYISRWTSGRKSEKIYLMR